MIKRAFTTATVVLVSAGTLLALLFLLARGSPSVASPALAAPLQAAPAVTQIEPAAGPNDLDTLIVITGSGFIATPTVMLGDTLLDDVEWVSATRLEATVPWGMDPAVYTLTVDNAGELGSLPGAFTVTQGIGVWNATELYGGSVNEIAVHPQTPETVYAVSADVGMFRSEDGAGSWTFKVAGGEYSVRHLAINPVSPTIVYMYAPWDLQRSDDGGDTWSPLSAPGDIPYPHPTEAGTVFVSDPSEGRSGLWKSTNYGTSWVTVTTGLTDTRVNNLVFDPTDPMTIYVGTELGNLFVSSDGGTSWEFVAQPLSYIQALAVNPRGDHELWASNCCFCQPNTTLRSNDAGHTTWEAVAEPIGSTSLRSIAFAPDAWGATYSQTVFVADCWDEVMRSDGGGDSWTSLDPDPGKANSAIALHPTDPDVLYVSSDTVGVFKTTDGGATWQAAKEGLTAVVPDHLATVAGQPDVVYAVSAIGLLKGTGGGATWQTLPVDGEVKFVATDPFTPSRVYAAGGDVGMGSDLPVYVSEDGGDSWPITGYLEEPARFDQYAHLNPILQPDPAQPGALLAGVRHAVIEQGGAEAGGLYRSTNAGLTWAEVDVGQAISPVQDIAFDVVSPTVIYIATSGDWHDAGSGVLRSGDGGLTWQQVGAAIADLDQAKSIAVEPRPPYRVFVLANGRVYVSEDRGLTWSQTGIWQGAIQSIYSSHDRPDSILYLMSGMGLYRSTDGGDTWGPATGVLGQVPVYSLAEAVTDDRTLLYVGTTGGYVGSGASQSLGTAAADASLANAGVYRYTARYWPAYLPSVLRAYGP